MPHPEDRPRAKSLDPLRALMPFLRPYRLMMVLALAALLMASASLLVLPVALRGLIDHGLATRSSATINRYFIGFLAAAVAMACSPHCASTWSHGSASGSSRICARRLSPRRAHGSPVLRDHAGRGGIVAPDHRYDARPGDLGGQPVDHPQVDLELVGALVLLGLTSVKLMGVILVLIPVVIGAADRYRPTGARAVARVAGPNRRYQQPGR